MLTGIHIFYNPDPNKYSYIVDSLNRIHYPTQGTTEALDILTRYRGLTICYHLEQAAAAIFKMIELPEKQGKQLIDKGTIEYKGFTITYFSNKVLCIDKNMPNGHAFVNLYNARQYEPCPLIDIQNPQMAVSLALRARQIGLDISHVLKDLGLPDNKLASPVAAFLKGFKDELNLPTVDDYPMEVGLMAYEGLKGNWLEAFAAGYWENAYDYDINGAYASELATLQDIRFGKWVTSRSIPLTATYGWAEGILRIPATTKFHPFIIKDKQGVSVTPTGTWYDTLSLQEINFLHKYNLGKFEINKGRWWIGTRTDFPLKDIINNLYITRLQANHKLVKVNIQRTLAGLWGKLSEIRREEFGEYFNPVYAAIVETNIRLRTAEMCLKNNIMPLHIAVDGIITEQPIPKEGNNFGDKLGQWRLSHQGKCYIVNSTVVGFEGKNGAEEFSLTYQWLDEHIKADPEAESYTMHKQSAVSLAKALNSEYQHLGKIEDLTRTVYMQNDNKRLWSKQINKAKDLLEQPIYSEPLDASLVGVII